MQKCLICEKKFIQKTSKNTICENASCKRENRNRAGREKRRARGLKRQAKDNNYSIEKIHRLCVYCGDWFETNFMDMDTCQSRTCRNKRAVKLRKIRVERMSKDELSRHHDKRKYYNGTGEKAQLSSLGQYHNAKCPMCKRTHRIRFEYGSSIEGTIYKYCVFCKQRAEKVDENTMMFGYIPELEEMKYEPVRA